MHHVLTLPAHLPPPLLQPPLCIYLIPSERGFFSFGDEERLPFEQMSEALEPHRSAKLCAQFEKKRKLLASKARETPIHARTDEDELAEDAASVQPGTGKFAPVGSGSRCKWSRSAAWHRCAVA